MRGVTSNKGFMEACRWSQLKHRPEAGGTCYTARLAQLRGKVSATELHSRISSTKSLASGEGNVFEPRLMSQVRMVREVVCA